MPADGRRPAGLSAGLFINVVGTYNMHNPQINRPAKSQQNCILIFPKFFFHLVDLDY